MFQIATPSPPRDHNFGLRVVTISCLKFVSGVMFKLAESIHFVSIGFEFRDSVKFTFSISFIMKKICVKII